jgi:transposase
VDDQFGTHSLTNTMLIRRCAQLEATTSADVTSAAVYTLRLLARRIRELTAEIRDLIRHITDTITRHCPTLLTRRGVGPDNAAALLITAGDNPDRLHSEASFAALCGINPLKASSGKTSRRRLNRGGDRQANCALYRIAICRLRCHARTRDYLARRITEGKTRREAIRCLKRYLARETYQIITSPPQAQPSAT